MSLEDKLRSYAAKGELVHVSLAFSNGKFHCNFAAASPSGGYTSASDPDPVIAIENAFKASPAKTARVKREEVEQEREEITAAVTEAARVNDEGLPADWTTP